jgi:DNA-binding NtrC family response regulator
MFKTYNLAILEDNDTHFSIIQKTLVEVPLELQINYKIERFVTVKEALEKLFGRSPDLLLIDLNVLDSSGFDTFKSFEKIHAPIVVMSILEDASLALRCIKGGTFYLVKDWFFQSPLILHLVLLRAYEVVQHRERIKILIRERLGEFKQLIPRCKYCIARIGEPRFKDESSNEYFTFTGYAETIGIKFTDGICPECFEDMRKAMLDNGH